MADAAKHFAIKTRRATRSNAGRRRTYRASKSEAKPLSAALNYFRRHILTDDAVTAAPDGAYTWIMKLRNGKLMLVAARARTEQELGTLHSNLDYFSGGGDIEAAGEFLKAGTEILYNLQSGTYMARRFPKRNTPVRKMATQAAIRATAEERFAELGLSPTFNKAPDRAPEEHRYAGIPIIDTMEILATVAEMEELDRLLSASSEAEGGT